MSMDVPVEIVMAAFASENGADTAMDTLKQAKRDQLIAIRAAAVLRRDAKGKLHVHERHDLAGAGGAATGTLIGLIAGMFAGPVGALVGGAAGAVGGSVGGRLAGRILSHDGLKELGASLTPGTSAIVALVEHTWVAELQADLQAAGAQFTHEVITADMQNQLAQGRDVTYSALEADGALVTGRASASNA